MKPNEAIQEIENWLLVPINFESILPALSALRNTSEFNYYVKRVADAEFKLPSDVVQDVDNYVLRSQRDRNRHVINNFNAKLDGPSEKVSTTKEELRTHKAETYAPARTKRPRRTKNKDGQIVPCCQRCGGATVEKTVSKIQPLGWVLFAVAIFVIPILCFVPLIVFQDKVQKYWCPNCRRLQDIEG